MAALKGPNGQQFPKPAWHDTLEASYSSGAIQAFILHLNTRDYVAPGFRMPQYIAMTFRKRDIVAFYDRANGFSFPLPSMEKRAKDILGMSAQAGGGGGNPAVDVLKNLGLQTGPSQAEQELPSSPGAALPLITKLLRSQQARTVVIVEWGRDDSAGSRQGGAVR